ncbi:2,3-bisphosphoglycerate-dependent phosphoglycerate mutase-like [Corticium candelabrum]|uniref:2,3-bisphosphoglycerate-dependent phosphoglycerate mutase-like n=1 Tax=Corticium candelabrum TaxID=121492 RepID=UPI002E266CA1|nr:2,3-bisphosphoglycerate-dependent phosphoglycerate mutase-like [Corticium candelabrum]XP_062511497.1 2,3-bisphosphoglycerate-dependent phosphoglycerate mutase-like [Corticium candelabrum]
MALACVRNSYFLLRHGESEANKAGIIVSDPKLGVTAFGLTELGKIQARKAAADLKFHISKQNLRHTDVVIASSDFKRAYETAYVVFERLDKEATLRTDIRLRERYFGDFDTKSNENYEIVWREDAVSSLHTKFSVESVASVQTRALAAVTELDATFSQKVIVLVAHGDTLQILQTAFLGVEACRHRELPPLATAELRQVALLQ